MSIADDFATYLKQLMADAKIPTVAVLSRETGVSQTVLGRWVNGQLAKPPEVPTLRKVVPVLGVPLLHLMVRSGIITPTEASMTDLPQPPGPRPTLEDDIRNHPDFDDDSKAALIHLLGRLQKDMPDEDGRRRRRPAAGSSEG